jgi:hypothetical protein
MRAGCVLDARLKLSAQKRATHQEIKTRLLIAAHRQRTNDETNEWLLPAAYPNATA